MKTRCLIEAGFPDAAAVKSAREALAHEGAGGRSTTKLGGSGKTLSIAIEADDVVALRAAANAYLRALAVFEGVERGANDE